MAKGFRKGLFESWAACEEAVKGFKGALFKSFMSRDEALIYLEQNGVLFGDKNLDKASYLVNFCIYGAFGAHGAVMLVEALNDWEREWGHVMPYGDVPFLFVLLAVFFLLKKKYQDTLKI